MATEQVPKNSDHDSLLAQMFGLFERLALSGALSGPAIEPWDAALRLELPTQSTSGRSPFRLRDCRIDDRSLFVLVNLILAKHDCLSVRSVDVESDGKPALRPLRVDPDQTSIFPGVYRHLPFDLIDEDPESGAYTFDAQLRQPVHASHIEMLENALRCWVDVVCAGGYEMASISPTDSYVEPAGDSVVAFDTTIEWAIFKLRADPDSINGIVNIFAAFHERCQPLVSLRIS